MKTTIILLVLGGFFMLLAIILAAEAIHLSFYSFTCKDLSECLKRSTRKAKLSFMSNIVSGVFFISAYITDPDCLL